MDNLPFELYLEIFQYLNLDDLLNCQSTSKKFKFIANQFRIKKLKVLDYNHDQDNLFICKNEL